MAAKDVLSDQATSEKQSFNWKIPNFVEMRQSEQLINAQSFTFEMGATIGLPSKWSCYLTVEEKKWIGVFLELQSCRKDIKQVHFHFRCEIPSSRSWEKFYYDNETNGHVSLLPGQQSWGFADVISRKGNISNLALPEDGTLTIHITVTIFNVNTLKSKPICPISASETKFCEIFAKKFTNDVLGYLYCYLEDYSTKVMSKDGREFMVNRGILAARSTVLDAMFQTQMPEMVNGMVKFDDISAEALDVLLHFCHTGSLKNGWKDDGVIQGLTYGAHKYMLEDLKQFLDEVLGYLGNKNNFGMCNPCKSLLF